MADTEPSTTEIVQRYYEVLQAGPEGLDADELRRLLASDLDFEGPIAGHRVGAEGFLVGVRGFLAATRGITLCDFVADGTGAAALYDAQLPGGPVRFAEFFCVEQGRIGRLRLLYDAHDYRARGGG